MALFRGVVDACDADPYLMRAAKWHGDKVARNCPVCKKDHEKVIKGLESFF